MLTEQNKAVYRRFIQEVFNEGRFDSLNQLVAEDYVLHDAAPGTPPGRDAIRQVVTMFRAAFPDFEITIEDQVAEGDKVCSRTVTRGTHQAPIFGIPPTGKAMNVSGLTMVRIVDGRVVESWVRNDTAGMMSQLNAGADRPRSDQPGADAAAGRELSPSARQGG